MTLYPHQLAAIQAANEHRCRGHKAGLWSIPTGAGKTCAFLALAKQWNLPTLVLVHRDELIRQTVRTAAAWWPQATAGIIQGPQNEWQATLTQPAPQLVVASVPSLHERRLRAIPADRFGLIISDEAHHAAAASWERIFEHFSDRLFLLGCTATPERADGEDLARWFGPQPIYTYALRQAIEDGMLSRLNQYAIETNTDLDDVQKRMGDFAENQLARAVNTPGRNRAIVEAWQKHAGERRTVAFCVNVDHVENLHQSFRQAGVNADYVHGGLTIDDRRERLARFVAGDTRLMCNCQILTEGWDDPAVDCAIMARPTQSRTLYIQMIGRILRLAEGKNDALALDITDNCYRHSLVTALDLFGKPNRGGAEGKDVLKTLDRQADAESRLARIKRMATGLKPVSWRLKSVCPWPKLPDLRGYVPTAPWHPAPATASQLEYLHRFHLEAKRNLIKGEASYLIDRCREYRAAYPEPATSRQQWRLKKLGLWRPGLTKQEASRLIGQALSAEGTPA